MAESTPSPPLAAPSALTVWWGEVAASALVGTARRPAPHLSEAVGVAPRADGDPESALLDQLALGASWWRAGARAGSAVQPTAAPSERMPLAPARALQLLDVALTQPPGGQTARDGLIALWAGECAAAGCRVPSRVLPELLDLAVSRPPLRPALLAIVGERGRWLAGLSPAWAKLLDDPALPEPGATGGAPDATDATDATGAGDPAYGPAGLPDGWVHLPANAQVAALTRARRRDPDHTRGALSEVWSSAPAKDRLAYLTTLATGLAPADEDFLETALDDRAASVRGQAARLLEQLPTSRRAARMAARLTPLVASSRGIFRGRSVTVALPDDPDTAGVRDGLGPAPQGRSVRGLHLEEIVAGAPLGVWAQLTEAGPAELLRLLGEAPDALAGLRRAAAAQHDQPWARAIIEHEGPSQALLDVLDPREAEALIVARLDQVGPGEAITLLQSWTGPWSPQLSSCAVAQLQRTGLLPVQVHTSLEMFADRLHLASAADLQRWLAHLAPDDAVRTRLARLLSSMTFRQSISEAFR